MGLSTEQLVIILNISGIPKVTTAERTFLVKEIVSNLEKRLKLVKVKKEKAVGPNEDIDHE